MSINYFWGRADIKAFFDGSNRNAKTYQHVSSELAEHGYRMDVFMCRLWND